MQLLVVAGGLGEAISSLDTVELLRDYRTATSWVVATGRLPRAVEEARMTLMGSHLFLTGGEDSSRNIRTGEGRQQKKSAELGSSAQIGREGS